MLLECHNITFMNFWRGALQSPNNLVPLATTKLGETKIHPLFGESWGVNYWVVPIFEFAGALFSHNLSQYGNVVRVFFSSLIHKPLI